MKDINLIRKTFKEKISTLSRKENIDLLTEWFQPSFENDNSIVSWISSDLKKTMRVQEAYPDETITFDAFLSKSRLNDAYDDLCIEVIQVDEKVNEIFEIYKLWFVDDIKPNEMEKIIDEYNKKL